MLKDATLASLGFVFSRVDSIRNHQDLLDVLSLLTSLLWV